MNEHLKLTREQVIRIYNKGYGSGHHDTVEGGFADIFPQDMESYHEEEVEEILNEFKAEEKE